MKLLIILVAFSAYAFADVSELLSGYDYPKPHYEAPLQQSYIAPEVHHEQLSEPIQAPQNSYLPPAHHLSSAPISAPLQEYFVPQIESHHEQLSQPINSYVPPVEHHEVPFQFESFEPAQQDGYRYKTVRRVVHRHRQ